MKVIYEACFCRMIVNVYCLPVLLAARQVAAARLLPYKISRLIWIYQKNDRFYFLFDERGLKQKSSK